MDDPASDPRGHPVRQGGAGHGAEPPADAEGPDDGTDPPGDEAPGAPGGLRVRGVGVDGRTRCAHWRSEVDVVAYRFPCCPGWWACHDCHEAVADHPAVPWPRERFGERAVLCGACRARLTIEGYLASPEACPRCGAAFNPRCRLHHPRYFEGA